MRHANIEQPDLFSPGKTHAAAETTNPNLTVVPPKPSQSITFEGWSSYATWHAVLHIQNEQSLYREFQEVLLKNEGPLTPAQAEKWFKAAANGLGLLYPGPYHPADINWTEIAEYSQIFWREWSEIPKTPVEVLKQSRVEGDHLYLPGQLTRKLYQDVMKVIDIIGGKWVKKEKAHVFEDDPWDAICDYISTGQIKNEKKEFQFFHTSDAVADQMVELAGIEEGMTILEPSAGAGHIADAIRRTGYEPLCCELWDKNRVKLEEKGYDLIGSDFLELTDIHPNRIIQNPPFVKGQDIRHFTHAYNLLAPGGRIVSILPPSWTFRCNRLYSQFREMVERNNGRWIELPEKAFSEAGTNVSTGILVLDKD